MPRSAAYRNRKTNRVRRMRAVATGCAVLLTAAVFTAGIAVRAEITAINDETAELERSLGELRELSRLDEARRAAENSVYSTAQKAEEAGMLPPGSAAALFVEPPDKDLTIYFPANPDGEGDEPAALW